MYNEEREHEPIIRTWNQDGDEWVEYACSCGISSKYKIDPGKASVVE